MSRAVSTSLLPCVFWCTAALAQDDDARRAEAKARVDALGAKVAELDQAGKYAEARPIAEQALKVAEEGLGPDHLDTATSLNNLALLLQAMGDLKGARPLLERALAIREKALGPDHPYTAGSLNNLARVLQDMGT